jgi:hypothetical protein
MLDEDNFSKLRTIQSRKMLKSKKGCSFSSVVNSVIEEGLKKPPKKKEQKEPDVTLEN